MGRTGPGSPEEVSTGFPGWESTPSLGAALHLSLLLWGTLRAFRQFHKICFKDKSTGTRPLFWRQPSRKPRAQSHQRGQRDIQVNNVNSTNGWQHNNPVTLLNLHQIGAHGSSGPDNAIYLLLQHINHKPKEIRKWTIKISVNEKCAFSLTCQEFKQKLQINTREHLNYLQIYLRRGKDSATALSISAPGTLSSRDPNMLILFMLKKYTPTSYVIMRQYLFQSKMPHSCHYLQFKLKNLLPANQTFISIS